MEIILQEKKFYARATCHQGECYNPVIAPSGNAIAYLKVEGKRESLIYKISPESPETTLTDKTYILSPHFAGNYLFWVEKCNGEWKIRMVNAENPNKEKIAEPFIHNGRPIFLSSCTSENSTWLVWEERDGKYTKIRMAQVNDGHTSSIVDVTNGNYNAYDPVCAVAVDRTIYVLYCAFFQGNYRIMLQKMNQEGALVDKAFVISNLSGSCMYPSICSRKDGGIWFSFTHMCSNPGYPPLTNPGDIMLPFIQHLRRQAQLSIFRCKRDAYAGIYDGERLLSPLAARNFHGRLRKNDGVTNMTVFSATGACHTHIFEDEQGRARLLLRQHIPTDNIVFQEDDIPLKKSEKFGNGPTYQTHPHICLSTLTDETWTEPVRIIPCAHMETSISYSINGNKLFIAFAEDNRLKGTCLGSEWYDNVGEIGVGRATVGLSPLGRPNYEIYPYTLAPVVGPSIEEPAFEMHDGKYNYAMGQVHAHTILSPCIREADGDQHLNYRYMQDVQHCSFGATTDHSFSMWHTEMLLTRKTAEYYYFPGKFIAFPAFEWDGRSKHQGGPFGHSNPLCLEEDGDLDFYTSEDPACPGSSLESLYKAYAKKNVVIIPHHTAEKGCTYNWNFLNENFSPVAEIFQDLRGSCEQQGAPGEANHNCIGEPKGHWVLDGLKQGKRFGFIGGGDHAGLALAGVILEELTRKALYEAMMKRRCFATTGISLRLVFTCNGRMMGETVTCKKGSFCLDVNAPEIIKEIQIVRNGNDFEKVSVNSKGIKHQWDVQRENAGEFWYVRIIFQNGEIAWTSPIWLE